MGRIMRYALSSLIAFIIIASPFLMITFSQPFYHREYIKNGLYSRVSEPAAKNYTAMIIAGLQDKEMLGKIDFMTENEKSHLFDVSRLIETVRGMISAAFLVIIVLLFANKKDLGRKDIGKILLRAGITSLVVIAIIIIASIASFQASFGSFHRLFFPQGNYLFPADSLLITFFPESFFRHAALCAGIISAALSAIIIVFGILLKAEKPAGKKRKRKKLKI